MPSKREQYQQSMKDQIDLWQARLASLTKKAGDYAKVEFRAQLVDWKRAGESAVAKLDELGASTGDRWDELKPGMDEIWRRLALVLDGADERIVGPIPERMTVPEDAKPIILSGDTDPPPRSMQVLMPGSSRPEPSKSLPS